MGKNVTNITPAIWKPMGTHGNPLHLNEALKWYSKLFGGEWPGDEATSQLDVYSIVEVQLRWFVLPCHLKETQLFHSWVSIYFHHKISSATLRNMLQS